LVFVDEILSDKRRGEGFAPERNDRSARSAPQRFDKVLERPVSNLDLWRFEKTCSDLRERDLSRVADTRREREFGPIA
jgi:hypothetical protein